MRARPDGAGPAAGALAVLGTSAAAAAGSPGPGRVECEAFHLVNDLPDALHPPIYVVMQAGSLAAVFAAGGVARWSGRGRLAAATVVTGVGVWAGAKVLKRLIRRGRPDAYLTGVKLRGREENGLGYPSGHAAVAFCLASIAAVELPRALRPLAWTVAGTVGLARIYVGAHLPLDVVGGAALGSAGAGAMRCLASAGRGEARARSACSFRGR